MSSLGVHSTYQATCFCPGCFFIAMRSLIHSQPALYLSEGCFEGIYIDVMPCPKLLKIQKMITNDA
jgi:hypothetical protein